MSGGAFRRTRVRKYAVPRGFAQEVGPPFEQVLALGTQGDGFRYFEAAVLALVAHGLLVLLAIFGKPLAAPSAPPKRREIPVVVAAPPPPKPEVPKPPPEPAKAEKPRLARSAPPPPAPKQAGKVVAAAADPNTPMDMTGFSMPVGEGRYEGGPVSAKPTPLAPTPSPAVVHAPPRPPAPPPGPSLAKPPGPARRDWSCTWPDDEGDGDLRDARVRIRVSVGVNGEPEGVDVLSSPNPSFAEAARRCAEAESYRAALNDAGDRVASITAPFIVHFVR